jgi:chemotaxis-related protein WspD
MLDTTVNSARNVAPAIDDCWNKIGVRGDASCPELQRHAHCRNCAVYASAAVKVLDRDIPAGYAAEWTYYVSMRKSASGETVRQSALIFRIGSEWFALPTTVLHEVVQERPIHSLPHRRNGILLGLVSVRGELIVCASLGKMLGLAETLTIKEPRSNAERDAAGSKRLVVVGQGADRIAFPAEEVQNIHQYFGSDLKEVPATITKAAAAYTSGILPWSKRLVGCLDPRLVMDALNRAVSA